MDNDSNNQKEMPQANKKETNAITIPKLLKMQYLMQN